METKSLFCDFGYCYYANAYRNVEDPRKRAEMIKEKHKMKDTNRKFRTRAINVLVSTSVVEEGIDVPSCNLVRDTKQHLVCISSANSNCACCLKEGKCD